MRTLTFVIATSLAFAAPHTAAQARGAATPAGLVRMVYADLARGGGESPLWWRYLSKHTRSLEGRLQALDQRAGNATIDYDWLCQCQDSEGLRYAVLSTGTISKDRVSAAVRIDNDPNPRFLRVLLVNEGGWKIDDIIDPTGNRYTTALERGIRRYSR